MNVQWLHTCSRTYEKSDLQGDLSFRLSLLFAIFVPIFGSDVQIDRYQRNETPVGRARLMATAVH